MRFSFPPVRTSGPASAPVAAAGAVQSWQVPLRHPLNRPLKVLRQALEDGVPRRLSMDLALAAWWSENPPPASRPGICSHCQKADAGMLMLYGFTGGLILHPHCHTAWMRSRRATGLRAIRKAMGR